MTVRPLMAMGLAFVAASGVGEAWATDPEAEAVAEPRENLAGEANPGEADLADPAVPVAVPASAPPSADPAVPAAADPAATGPSPVERARAHYEEGMLLYKARDFSRARAAFERSHALDPLGDTLFAWAQATRLAGDCAAAEHLFARFVATGPPARQLEAARLARSRCVPAVAATTAVEDGKTVALETPARATRAWQSDVWGGALVGSGVAFALVGGALYLAARSSLTDDARNLGEKQADQRDAFMKRDLAVGAVVAGGILAVAGMGRYLRVWLARDNTGLTVAGHF